MDTKYNKNNNKKNKTLKLNNNKNGYKILQ